MLTVEEKENIAGGFKAAGERIQTVEQTVEETKGYLNEIEHSLKRYTRGILNASMDAGEYRGFWRNTEEARAFGELSLVVLGRKAMGEAGSNVEGGALVPVELSDRVIQKMGQYGKFRKNALVLQLGSDRQLIPKAGLAYWAQEGQDERLEKEYPVQKGQDKRLEKEYPAYKISDALKRLELIRKFSSLKDKFTRQTGSAQRGNLLASETVGVPMRTIRRWLSQYDRLGLRGLIDHRGIKK